MKFNPIVFLSSYCCMFCVADSVTRHLDFFQSFMSGGLLRLNEEQVKDEAQRSNKN